MSLDEHRHDHVFLGAGHRRNERRVWLVITLTAVTMVAEIAAGAWYGSMALVADGWHMSTHAVALLISALAYLYARRRARDPRFSFGTGKFGDLAGFASAIVLALVALLMAWESSLRILHPVAIGFSQAIGVAVIGLLVNVLSAVLLSDDHHHAHSHHAHQNDHADHADGEDDDRHHDERHHPQEAHRHHGDHAAHDHRAGPAHGHDNNLRSAYVHVIADAFTSVLAIVALALGSLFGWLWLDPLMGIVGSLVIAQWSIGLMRSSGRVLLDVVPLGTALPEDIRRAIETREDRITDLHVWQVGPGHHAAIVALAAAHPREPSFYKEKLQVVDGLSHVTIEVSPLRAA